MVSVTSDLDLERPHYQGKLLVCNRLGLHARAAAQIAALAQKHQAEIILENNGLMANARNILEILSLGCTPGTTVEVRVQGPEASQALQALQELFRLRFGEP
ncbi:MAG: HPr family phosphocarrier protein [Deltaproteobacteria bacterium]|nr:HPr family phosphocarrier protein [Deltaproteobacteria bacterium]MBW1951794.1 HPr family phosphocarrier protein [Deltaproteobacteria bacterium]MBW1985640.1 HPr family phosphocarrier protein [Deltaproteobacteria bacterium]MBW2134420.1 HPr family phosphocarrier protein [Deltaproteobacteria bacterium]